MVSTILPSASGPSSIVHPSGRILPVGIAQPIQSQSVEQRGTQYHDSPWASEKTDSAGTTGWKEGGGEGGQTGPLVTKPGQRSAAVAVDDEAAVREVMSQLETDLSSSDSDSDSSSNNEDADGMDSGLKESLSEGYSAGSIAQSLTVPPSSSSLASQPPRASLPASKRHHVFLSHSTGDQLAVKTGIIVPLRDSHSLQVVASYHCMEGNQYNDKHIEKAMAEGCVVVLALSPSYLESPR